jgi:uncharacterized OsmC-like protein
MIEGYEKLIFLLNVLRKLGISFEELKIMGEMAESRSPELKKLIETNTVEDLKGKSEEEIERVAEEMAEVFRQTKKN